MTMMAYPYPPQQTAVVATPIKRNASLWEWYKSLDATQQQVQHTPVQSAILGLRSNVTGGGVGALLALIKHKFGGLDTESGVPKEVFIALGLWALSIKDTANPDGLESTFRDASAACSTVMSYRLMDRWLDDKESGRIPKNKFGDEDSILAAGRNL